MDEITIHVFLDSEGEYQYDIYEGAPEAAKPGASVDGGACTSTMKNAIDMAADQAKALLGPETTLGREVQIRCGFCDATYLTNSKAVSHHRCK